MIPGFIWWLGWYPGFATTDTVDQFAQAQTEQYFHHHPPIHTLYLDILSLDGTRAGAVTLFQLLLFGALMVYAAHWLTRAGVPAWLSVGVALLLGISPAVAPTTLALWKDIPFGLFLLWAWIELLALVVDPPDDRGYWPYLRLGIALAGVWTFRGNGPLTVLVALIAMFVLLRKQTRGALVTTGALALVVILIVGPIYALLDISGPEIEPAQVFLPDIAGSYNREPETFTARDLQLLEAVAPLEVWRNRYDCYHSTPLVFDPRFNQERVRERPGLYRELELDVLTRDPDSVLEHRVCAANFVYWPPQPEETLFHRLPYEMPENEVGLYRRPIITSAFFLTDAIWHWAEPDERLWLTWRPAIVVLPALLAVGVFSVMSSGRRFLLPSSLFVAHVVNVMATSPGQEFRYAYPLYMVAVLTLPLLQPTIESLQSDPT